MAVALLAVVVVAGLWVGGRASPFGESDADDRVIHSTITLAVERDPNVPELPFADNPDPSQCGIPTRWGEGGTAWLTGMWEGELIQPEVLLYDSHLRTAVVGGAPHGTEVEVIMYQENPVLDYYFIKIAGEDPQEGWIPEPFLSFEPLT